MSDQEKDDAGIFAASSPSTLTFGNLITAKAVEKNGKARGEPKYSSNFEIDPSVPAGKTLLDDVKAKMVAVAKAKWPGRNLSELSFPLTDGNKLADKAKTKGKDREWSRGKAVLTARSKFPPRLSALIGGKVVDFQDEDVRKTSGKYFYTGVQALFEVNFVAYDAVDEDGKDGVTAYLNVVLSLNKGEKLAGGGKSAAETFKSYVGTTSDEDPTGGAAVEDEIPF